MSLRIPSLAEVIGEVAPEALAPARAHLAAQGEVEEPPWYVRGLMGLGAWIAAALMLLSLILMNLADEGGATAILGLVICGGAVAMARVSRHDFTSQLSLALSLLGQGLCLAGAAFVSREPQIIALSVVLLEAVLVVVHPHPVHRALSTLALAAALISVPLSAEAILGAQGVGVVILWAAGAAWLGGGPLGDVEVTWPERGPVAWGLALAALAVVLVPVMPEAHRIWSPWIVPVGVTVGLVAVVAQVMRASGQSLVSGHALAALAAAAATGAIALKAPGIGASLAALIIGVHRRRLVLVGGAVLALLGFVGFWYYSLTLTLLDKSIALTATGAVLLLLALGVSRWR